ncbi:MAG: methyltransferase domain-containing protein [Methanobacteriaceae archaeon]|nr:methyltransferase domain-containing protein [Methanobacteriaceae archaeon]
MYEKTFKMVRIMSKFPGIFQKIVYYFLQEKINYEAYYKNLQGKEGLEIGGPTQIFKKNNKLPIYPWLKSLDGCNFSENTVWHDRIEKGKLSYDYDNRRRGYQYICDAVDLKLIEDGKYDFLLASHVLEHIANPLKALHEWLRVVKEEGTILLIVPHKEATFDHQREVTTLSHLKEDFKNNVDEKDLTHLPEILKLHDYGLHNPTGDVESFRERSLHNYENRCLHQHVFDIDQLMKLFNHLQIEVITVDIILPHNLVILGQKTKKIPIKQLKKLI